MKQGVRSINSVQKEANTYLMVELERDAVLLEFCVEMSMRNQIFGILPMNRQFINGTDVLQFEVTGLRCLSSVLNGGTSSEAVLLLLKNMVDTLLGLPEYFLHASQCVLELDYIYTTERGQPGFLLIPIRQEAEEGNEPLRKLLMDFMGRCTSSANQNRYAPLMACLLRPAFQITEFSDVLNDMVKPVSSPAPPKRPRNPAGQKAQPNMPGHSTSLEQTERDLPQMPHAPSVSNVPRSAEVRANVAPPQQGFAIPGGGVVPAPKTHEKRESKEGGIFRKPFFFGRGRKEAEHKTYATLLYMGRTIPIDVLPFTIGRQGNNFDLGDNRVSQPHATIMLHDGKLSIMDENSLNYTFVNYRQLQPKVPEPLSDGAELQLGPAVLTVKM